MVKIRYKVIEIRVNELQTSERTVPVWELPILQAVHGIDNITEVRDTFVERNAPAPDEEYTRLTKRYRQMLNEDGSKGQEYTAAVFGQFAVGTQTLARLIADATEQFELPLY